MYFVKYKFESSPFVFNHQMPTFHYNGILLIMILNIFSMLIKDGLFKRFIVEVFQKN